MSDIKLLSIDSAELSVRSKNALHREGIHTIGEMLECTEERLLCYQNILVLRKQKRTAPGVMRKRMLMFT